MAPLQVNAVDMYIQECHKRIKAHTRDTFIFRQSIEAARLKIVTGTIERHSNLIARQIVRGLKTS